MSEGSVCRSRTVHRVIHIFRRDVEGLWTEFSNSLDLRHIRHRLDLCYQGGIGVPESMKIGVESSQ